MPRQDRILVTLLILHGLFGVAWIWWVGRQSGFFPLFVIPAGVLALIGVTGGVGLFRRRRWGWWLGVLFYLIQVVDVWTAGFRWVFTLGLSLDVELGWIGDGGFGVDLLALAMLVWLAARRPAGGDPLRLPAKTAEE